MLTAKEIIEEKLLTNIEKENIQQVGIDCNIIGINKVVGVGIIPTHGKTILPAYEPMEMIKPALAKQLLEREVKGWTLPPGYYEIVLRQGCNLPSNRTLMLKQRSSLCRSGALIQSGIYDPGFETKNIGAFLDVTRTIFIEKGARVCQAYILESSEVDNLYKGQYQNDIQRSGK